MLPSPGCPGGIARLPVNPREVQAECGSLLVFVLGRDEAKGFVLVASLEGFLFAGDEVFAVEGAPIRVR